MACYRILWILLLVSKFFLITFFSGLLGVFISAQALAEPISATQHQRQVDALNHQVSQADTIDIKLSSTVRELKRELDELRRTASNAISSADENRQLKMKLRDLDQQRQLLANENSSLKGTDQKQWFLAGAVVLFSGILLGLILPRLRLQRKTNYSDF